MPERRFPPPWTVEEYNNACFIVTDSGGQNLAYVYFEEETAPTQALRHNWRAGRARPAGGKAHREGV